MGPDGVGGRSGEGEVSATTHGSLLRSSGLSLHGARGEDARASGLVGHHLELHEEHLGLEEGGLLEDAHGLGERLDASNGEIEAALEVDFVEALSGQDAVGVLEVGVVGLTELEGLRVRELGHVWKKFKKKWRVLGASGRQEGQNGGRTGGDVAFVNPRTEGPTSPGEHQILKFNV